VRIRRCTNLWLEPREVVRFHLDGVLGGGTGRVGVMQWVAHAAHLSAPVEVDADDVDLLGGLSPTDWIPGAPLRAARGAKCMRRLLRAGLLIGTGKHWALQRAADEAAKAQHWHSPAAAAHVASRWQGVDSAAASKAAGLDTTQGMRAVLGAPLPTRHERGDARATFALERATRDAFDDLLDTRVTCRNFATNAELPLASLARLLERVFGARGMVHGAPELDVLKKTSPSGGALHPTECYLIARKVAGLPRGLYHYRPVEHALRPLPFDMASVDGARHPGTPHMDALDALAWIAVGGQSWFAEAHALCVLAPRFGRSFWKYREHPKAYRVCILDVGHLSQTFQLCATEAGLGSYVTAAINEVDIERAFGLDHWSEGPLAVCGVGVRSTTMRKGELDPDGKAWPRA